MIMAKLGGAFPSLWTIVLVSVFAASACKRYESEAPEQERTKLDKPLAIISFRGVEGVVLPKKLALDALNQCSRPTPRPSPDGEKGIWEPSAREIERLERSLSDYVAAHAPTLPSSLAVRLSQYKRQYIGLYQKEKKIIYVNLFLWDPGGDWRTQAVVVCNGGATFWGIEFDLSTGAFSNLFTNGEG